MTLTLEQALARLEASAEPETFFQTSFVLLKILQNVVSSPEDEKYRRIRCASKVRRTRCASPPLGGDVVMPDVNACVCLASESERSRRGFANSWLSRRGT